MGLACGQTTPATIDWQEVEEFIDAPIPDSAINQHAEWERGIDRLVRIKLTLPTNDLDSFLTELGFTTPLSKGVHRLNSADSSSSWWDVDNLINFSGGSFNRNSKNGDVAITPAVTDMTTIYLVIFEQ